MKINKTVRKENYERGMKYGNPVYCGQDLRDFIGMTIRDINSDDLDKNVIMWLENEERSVALYFDDICFDGEHIRTVAHSEDSSSFLLRPVIENRYKEIKMVLDAIGRLTPQKLLQLYPVTKEYDGERWDCKDYFYTMDKLKQWPPDKPSEPPRK